LFCLKTTTYKDNQKALRRPDKYADYDSKLKKFIMDNQWMIGKFGYRQIMKQLTEKIHSSNNNTGIDIVIERRIRKVLKDNNWQMNQRKSMRKYDSYMDNIKSATFNWLYDKDTKTHFFKPENTWEILGTDVTEFHVNGFKCYLSMIIDFNNSLPVCWRISKHPDTDLIVGSVADLIDIRGDSNLGFILHMDQGSVNRSNAMKDICLNNHILQSMSRKGNSGDNAPTEGFFGRLKQMWFNGQTFNGYDYNRFTKELNEFLILWSNDFNVQNITKKLAA
jgi:transposase InsO family protein